jgi:hypothetical protein
MKAYYQRRKKKILERSIHMENQFDVRNYAWEIWDTAHKQGVDVGVAQDIVLGGNSAWRAMSEKEREAAIAPYLSVAGREGRYFELCEAYTEGNREKFEKIIREAE